MKQPIRRTKIVATLGPATDRGETLQYLLAAGVNMVRMNFSHGSREDHVRRAETIRKHAKARNLSVAILGDLQGPKIRISTFQERSVDLYTGDRFILDAHLPPGEGTKNAVGIDYKALIYDVVPGDQLLLDDGRITLHVDAIQGHCIHTVVLNGGTLSNNKGLNKLGGGLSADALTEKDKADMQTAAELEVDYIAISFPRSSQDILLARELLQQCGSQAQIVAKIERAEAVADDEVMKSIILASDAIMVARGDLGVEIGDDALIGVQKKLIHYANQLHRVVITATQMMESMISSSLPTRAEVMDVANAVLDGTDAVMLSAETASGNHPAAVVETMARICLGAEAVPDLHFSAYGVTESFSSVEEGMAMSAMFAANHLYGVAAIVCLTVSGKTALYLSRIRSSLPIFALSEDPRTLRLVNLYKGVTPIFFQPASDTPQQNRAEQALLSLQQQGYLETGDLIIVTEGDLGAKIGSTNTCRALRVR